ncbi:Ohr subfamily peroxiredoxin [Actinocorallia herbida]|uniref:Ohr subfamily peroxiredoxin n=1 Tax=Actinocorallia herbida TaxID=58109 RepID=A0A3N1CVQ8_9ACTN|nr:Ohr family peroxiredoxin [Actinocorallia herbida]ROO85380.1 Ohr subfamily peroxiredoxin [Actinocorallia herbida]
MSDPTADGAPGGTRFKPLYEARVAVDGGILAHGRATGRARSGDGALAFDLRMPAELGGDGGGPNPEQLFAAAFAASVHGELTLVARQHLLDPAPITVQATVAVGRDPADGGYLLQANVEVAWPGVPRATARRLLARALTHCPYTKMTARGIPATVALAPEPGAG